MVVVGHSRATTKSSYTSTRAPSNSVVTVLQQIPCMILSGGNGNKATCTANRPNAAVSRSCMLDRPEYDYILNQTKAAECLVTIFLSLHTTNVQLVGKRKCFLLLTQNTQAFLLMVKKLQIHTLPLSPTQLGDCNQVSFRPPESLKPGLV